jgi:prepilin-type N-terminal cleavage/methylation domain-containing protein
MHRSAFTLIEMLVVLVLAAILATIVTVSMTRSVRAAQAEDVAGRIATYDRLARDYCRRFGKPGRLVFDLGSGTITRVAGETDTVSPENVGGALHLPSGVVLSSVVTESGTATAGSVSIHCSADGQTPSYAIELTDVRGQQSWIVTAGLTGKTLKVSDGQEVQDIFRTMRGGAAPAGDDAH